MIVPKTPGTVGAGSTSVTPGLPAGLIDGETVLIYAATKPDTATFNTPASWTNVVERAGGGGTNGVGTGPTRGVVYSRTKDAGWSTMPAISITSGNSSAGYCTPYLPAAGSGTSLAATSGEYTGNGTSWSATMDADPGITEGDRLLVFCTNQDDAPTWSAQSLSVPGCTLTATFERTEGIETTTGNDMGGMLCEFLVRSGTSSGAATFTATTSAASRGVTLLVRMRETSIPNNLIDGVEPEAACGFAGPYLDGNGNLYRLTEEFLSTNQAQPEFGNHPMMMKSVNGGGTWKRMDGPNGPGYGLQGSFNDMESAAVVQRIGTQELVVLWEKASDRWWGTIFRTSDNASPDTWNNTNGGTSSGLEQFTTAPATESGIAGVSLSTGKVRAFVMGNKQSTFDAFRHAIMAAGGTSWDIAGATYITKASANLSRPCPVVDGADMTWLYARDHTNGQVHYCTINTSDTVSGWTRVDTSGAGAGASVKYFNNVVPPVYYDDGGSMVTVVAWVNASDQLIACHNRNGSLDSPQTVTTNTLTVNPLDLGGSSTDNQGPSAALAVLGNVVYAFWGEVIGSSGDVYYATSVNGGAWSSRTLFVDTGSGRECQWMYAKAISDTRIALTIDYGRHFDDDSNIFYAELDTAPDIVQPPRRPT